MRKWTCPACGSETGLDVWVDTGFSTAVYQAECSECGAKGPVVKGDGSDDGEAVWAAIRAMRSRWSLFHGEGDGR